VWSDQDFLFRRCVVRALFARLSGIGTRGKWCFTCSTRGDTSSSSTAARGVDLL
jgi:hypothetical protein